MQTITINKKKFVIIELKEFERIRMMAIRKSPPQRKFLLDTARKRSKKLIDKWVKESKKQKV